MVLSIIFYNFRINFLSASFTSMSQGRSVWRMIVTNFVKSFKLLPPEGKLVGQDQLGNKYYEASENRHSMRKAGNRWFEPKVEGDWQQSLPAEWEAWLRGRRRDAPTEEEVEQNLALAKTKKIKGDEIAARDQAASPSSNLEEKRKFPKLEDYEKDPGQFSDRKTH